MSRNNTGRGFNTPERNRRTLAVVATLAFIGLCLMGIVSVNEGQYAGSIQFEDNGFVYEVIDGNKGTLSIIGYHGTQESLVIPSNIRYLDVEYKVGVIGDRAFGDCGSITSVTIPDGITSVGDDVFNGCGNLVSVTMPVGLFLKGSPGTDRLTTLTFTPTNHESIDKEYKAEKTQWGFESSRVDTIVISEGVTAIPDYMFHESKALRNLTLPSTLTEIGKGAFEGCDSLNVELDLSRITSLGDYAFKNCNAIASVTLPLGIENLGRSVFENCKALKSVVIPENIISLNRSTFKGCTGLIELTVPIGVNTVVRNSDPAFEGCTSIEKVTLTGSGNGFNYNDNTYTPWRISKDSFRTLVVEDGVKTIGKNTLRDCVHVTDISLPEGLTEICENAFRNLEDLKSIDLPSSLTLIGKAAFRDCDSLTGILIPEGVTRLKSDAFRSCKSLTTAVIPDSVVEAGFYAFGYCSELKDITFPMSLDTYGYYVTENVATTVDDYYPVFADCFKIERITLTAGTGELRDYHYMYERMKESIANLPWMISKSLKTVVIAEGAKTICPGLFNGLNKEFELVLPNSLEKMNGSILKGFKFYGLDGGTPIDISPENLRGKTFKGKPGGMVEQ